MRDCRDYCDHVEWTLLGCLILGPTHHLDEVVTQSFVIFGLVGSYKDFLNLCSSVFSCNIENDIFFSSPD